MVLTFPQKITSQQITFLFYTLLLLLLSGFYTGCAKQPVIEVVEENNLPLFIDDEERSTLLSCSQKHLQYVSGLPAGHVAVIGDRTYPKSWLQYSLQSFIKIIKNTPEQLQLNHRIREEFLVFKAGGRKEQPKHKMLVTGYYEPLFEGSLESEPPYLYPLYSLPDSLVKIDTETPGINKVGRYEDSSFVPFWTRQEIETLHVLGGNELVYLKDPFDAFLLHVQGSGRIQLENGTVRTVRFAGHNGHQYNSIGKLLVEERKITLEDASVPVIRDYLISNPSDLTRVLHHNPRFIFFEWGNNAPPRGSTGVSLTPGRSIAVDQQVLPSEAIGYLISRKPFVDSDGQIIGWSPLTRFVIPQDSGNAIKGPGRVDLFFGNGAYAEAAAGNTAEMGELYFLIKKGYTAKSQSVSETPSKE